MRKTDLATIALIIVVLGGVVFTIQVIRESRKTSEERLTEIREKRPTNQELMGALGDNPNKRILNEKQKQELIQKLGVAEATGELTREQLKAIFPSVDFDAINNQQLEQ